MLNRTVILLAAHLFVGDSDNESDGDDDACVEIPLVTPLHSVAVIPSSGNWGQSSTAPAAEGPNTRMPFMVDLLPFFPAGPYYATYPQDGVARNCEFTHEEEGGDRGEVGVTQIPYSLGEMVSELKRSKSQAKEGEEEKDQVSLTKSLDNLHAKVARLSVALNQATVLEAEKDEEILRLKTTPLELASFFRGYTGFERGLSMHQTKDEFAIVLKKMANFMSGESTVTPASKSLEFSANVDLTASAVASDHNEEMVNAEDVVELAEVGSGRASSGPNDVVVALSVGEKGDGLVPSSAAGEEAADNSFGV
ncbi:hypothetical protein Tco_1447581 [Tanacetum coccineum]